jgi:CRISPR-associated protein Csm4
MKLYRFRIVPESPWRTPWQSDTLSGLLCWTCARTEGDTVLNEQLIQPALEGKPPFVLSDAFPGDCLPVPMEVRLANWPADKRKDVKRARWLPTDAFQRWQRGEAPTCEQLTPSSGVREYAQLRNSISRASGTTAAEGGLYPTEEAVLEGTKHLTVYVRVRDEVKSLFWQLLEELTTWGFGADRTAGKGQFRLDSELERADDLDAASEPQGCVALSTFQPNAGDPVEGFWEAFTKYGKLGPDFGVGNVFKRPLILFRPGACFHRPVTKGWLGRAIPMAELLALDTLEELRDGLGANVVHWAFGLCVPASKAWNGKE